VALLLKGHCTGTCLFLPSTALRLSRDRVCPLLKCLACRPSSLRSPLITLLSTRLSSLPADAMPAFPLWLRMSGRSARWPRSLFRGLPTGQKRDPAALPTFRAGAVVWQGLTGRDNSILRFLNRNRVIFPPSRRSILCGNFSWCAGFSFYLSTLICREEEACVYV